MGKTKTFPTKTELTPPAPQETKKENLMPQKEKKHKRSEPSVCATVSGQQRDSHTFPTAFDAMEDMI